MDEVIRNKTTWLWCLLVFGLPVVMALIERFIGFRTFGAWAWKEQDGMPRELRNAEVFLNEAPISFTHPFTTHGRVDQVFLTQRGTLIVLDTKYRLSMKVKTSDVLQLSCYAVALRQSYDKPVARYGYVRLVNDSGDDRWVRYVRVRLLSESAIRQRLGV